MQLPQQTAMLASGVIFLTYLLPVLSAKLGSTYPSSYHADVLILGGGVAGIAAAKTLHDRGIDNFLILEANHDVGGRMRSREFGGIVVEEGAQTIAGYDDDHPERFQKKNPVWLLAKRCGLKGESIDVRSRVFYEGSRRILDPEYLMAGMDYSLKSMKINKLSKYRKENGLPDMSVRKAYNEVGWNQSTPAKQFMDWSLFDMGYGSTPETTSLYKTYPFKTSDDFGDDIYFIADKRGSEHLIHCLAEDFMTKNDPRLKLNSIVNKIEWCDNRVCVTATREGHENKYCAKHAISTFSIGVLQSTRLQFLPKLPTWKIDVINKYKMTNIMKVFVKFDHAFWDQVMFIDRADKVRGRYPVVQPLSHFKDIPDDANILQLWLASDKADIASVQPINEIKQEVLQVLKETYPNAKIPEPIDIMVTNWKTDPLFGGAVSSKPIGITDEDYIHLADPVGQLFFSGEATHVDYNGLLQGGYIAGVDTANKVADRYYENN